MERNTLGWDKYNFAGNFATFLVIETLLLKLVKKNLLTIEEARTMFTAPQNLLGSRADTNVDMVAAFEVMRAQLNEGLQLFDELSQLDDFS